MAAAASTAALGRGGREEAGVLGRDDVVADEVVLGGFRSPARDLAVVTVALGSTDGLDGAGVLPETLRPPRVLVALDDRPLVVAVPRGATEAGANTGVPPFWPHDAERGRAGAVRIISTLRTSGKNAAYRLVRRFCSSIEP